MEFFEYITYILIFLVLMSFIGVISYIIYDNYTYKNNLTSDLNTNFIDINQNFDATSNIINKLYKKHSSNINVIDARVYENSNLFTNNIIDINTRYTASSNLFKASNNLLTDNIIDINSRYTASSNLFKASSNLFTSNIDTFSYNLNKFFTFNNNNTNFNDTNRKIYEYRTSDNNISKLELIAKTTAISGLQLNTNTDKELGICNSDGTKCFRVLSTDNTLSIYKPTTQGGGNSNIYIGGNDDTAPLKIVNGEVFINGHKYRPPPPSNQPPSNNQAPSNQAPSNQAPSNQPPSNQAPSNQPPVSIVIPTFTNGGPSTSGNITTPANSSDKFMIFTTTGINHTFTVPAGGINCDILMIGGGGGAYSSGSGAGACIVAINQTLPVGTCVVNVGSGASQGNTGNDSYIQVAGVDRYRAKGGASGTNGNANSGGCGGGPYSSSLSVLTRGFAVSTNIVNGSAATIGPGITSTYAVLGNAGGNTSSQSKAGGGGGIGTAGDSTGKGGDGAYQVTINNITYNFRDYFANGGNNFGVQDGTTGNYYIGGGGGGSDTNTYVTAVSLGGSGRSNANAIANTGSGAQGGTSGGSGIIIIRLRA